MRADARQLPANRISFWIAGVERALVVLSGAAMAAIMCIVVFDVVMRYAFSAPLVWSYDLIGLYLVGLVFFFALSDTMQEHGHIALDIFTPLLPRRVWHLGQAAGYLVSVALIGAITWLGLGEAQEALAGGDVTATVVPLPTWVAHAVLALGMGVLGLRCLYRVVGHLRSVLKGRDMVEVPPPPITTRSASEHAE